LEALHVISLLHHDGERTIPAGEVVRIARAWTAGGPRHDKSLSGGRRLGGADGGDFELRSRALTKNRQNGHRDPQEGTFERYTHG
jgi:hypothetical protein